MNTKDEMLLDNSEFNLCGWLEGVLQRRLKKGGYNL